eukprot:s882_g3.t1
MGEAAPQLTPKLIWVPVNPLIAPPWEVKPNFTSWHSQWLKAVQSKANGGSVEVETDGEAIWWLAQCSLSSASAIMEEQGYTLLHLEHTFAVFVLKVVWSAVAPLLRRAAGSASGSSELKPGEVSLYDHWTRGWHCSPVAPNLFGLEQAPKAEKLLILQNRSQEATGRAALCEFLQANYVPLADSDRNLCSLQEAAPPALSWRSWELQDQLEEPGKAYMLESTGRGRCLPELGFCECFPPYRGRYCENEQPGKKDAQRPYKAVLHYLVGDREKLLSDFQRTLPILWQRASLLLCAVASAGLPPPTPGTDSAPELPFPILASASLGGGLPPSADPPRRGAPGRDPLAWLRPPVPFRLPRPLQGTDAAAALRSLPAALGRDSRRPPVPPLSRAPAQPFPRIRARTRHAAAFSAACHPARCLRTGPRLRAFPGHASTPSGRARVSRSLAGPWSPPRPRPVASDANSWLYVPLLHASTGGLDAAALDAWRRHPLCQPWWEEARSSLQAAGGVPLPALANALELSPLHGASAALHALLDASAHLPAGAHLHLGWVVRLLSDEEGYLSAPVQEACLQLYGGLPLAAQLDASSNQFRRIAPPVLHPPLPTPPPTAGRARGRGVRRTRRGLGRGAAPSPARLPDAPPTDTGSEHGAAPPPLPPDPPPASTGLPSLDELDIETVLKERVPIFQGVPRRLHGTVQQAFHLLSTRAGPVERALARVFREAGARVTTNVYAGLVTTLSANKDQLEPCTERCLQFKFFSDGSAIPGTGMFPFPVQNGQGQQLLSETCASYGGMDCEAFIGACSVSRCEERHVRGMVEDRLSLADIWICMMFIAVRSRSKSKMGFIASIAVYSALNLAHDLGLEAHLLGPNDAVMLQIFVSLSMAVMAACALMWASGAMEPGWRVSADDPIWYSNIAMENGHELFYSPSESCGCYFRLAAVPSVVALALPLNLVSRLRSNVQQAMYAAIIESSCLRTEPWMRWAVSFSIPYHFIETSGINGAESLGQLSLLGVKGLGCPRRAGLLKCHPSLTEVLIQSEAGHVKTHNPWLLFDRLVGAKTVKRCAQWLPLLSVGIILFPLLFSSSFIVYRISDLFLAWLEGWLSKHVGQHWTLDRSCGTLALFGVYSMIGMQALVIGYFLSGLWTLYSILAVQLGDWPSDPQMLARLISAKPELRLGELSNGLREEFEGCLLDLEKVPEKPADSEAAKWSEAYMGIRHCNEQLELKITEIREKISQKDEAISQKLSSTRTLLSTARRLRASVSDAEFAAHTARQRATAAQAAQTAEDEGLLREALARLRGEPVELQVANALAQHAGLLPSGKADPDPVPPLVEMAGTVHEKMLQTAMVSPGDSPGDTLWSRHLVELAWISESQEPFDQGGVLPSVSPDELEDEKSGDYYGWTATMDLGPIKYKGIKFTDIQLDRYNREKGSSFYFLELQMPLGLQLEEVEVDGVGTVIQVTEIVDGGSAKEDKSIRVGDYLRAITTPQRKLSGEEGEEGHG